MSFRNGLFVVLATLLVAASAVVPMVSTAVPSSHAADDTTVAGSTVASGAPAVSTARGPDVSIAREPDVSTVHVQTRNAPAVVAASDGNIHQRTQLSLTPDRAGQVAATTRYDIPDAVRSLQVRIPAAATIRTADGFQKEDERTYIWDESTSSPRLVYDFSVNRTFEGAHSPHERAGLSTDERGAIAADSSVQTTAGEYSFVDVGSWAITQVPSMGVSWRYTGTADVGLRKSTTVDGEGATGGEIAYLGPFTEHTRTANDQQFRLVVPQAATLRESPADVLDSLVSASDRLAVGERDAEVFFVAAPTTVDWGSLGLEYGGSDAWVRADSRLDTATNVWLHEYVHMRQGYQPSDATRWSEEGTADYYAALLTFEQGRITFDTFRDRLRQGTTAPASSAILADPTTWEGFANYLKGALVWGVVDFHIRTAGDRSADNVFARLNRHDEQISATVFLDAVARAGDSETRQMARRYTETRETPEPWSREEHSTAFTGPDVRVSLDRATYQVSGPYREGSIAPQHTLVVEEALTVSVPVTNVGDQRALSDVTIRYDGETIERERVEIEPGGERTITVRTALERTGTYTLETDSGTVAFTVAEPASVTTRGLSVAPDSVPAGAPATVSVVVGNDADRPAAGTVELTADGERLGSEHVRLDVDDQTTLSFTVSFDEPGIRTLRVGEASATLEVREPTRTAANGSLPGSIAVLGVLLAALLARRRAER